MSDEVELNEKGDGSERPSAERVTQWAELTPDEAIPLMRAAGWWNLPVAILLAEWALERADVNPAQAGGALAIATLFANENG